MNLYCHTKWVARCALMGLLGSAEFVHAQNQAVPPAPIAPAQPGWISGHAGQPVVVVQRVPLSQEHGVTLPAIMPFIDLPMLNVAPLLIEDGRDTTGEMREGVTRDIPQFDMAMGNWFDVPGGGWVWVLDVKLPGAFGVRPHFADFQLPPGVEAIVYHPDHPTNLPTPYVDNGPLLSGEFWAFTSWSDTARVEVYFPPEIGDGRFANIFRIDQVAHFYRNPATGLASAFGTRELPCHLDVQCSNGWAATNGRGVGRMSFMKNGVWKNCSGSLIATGAGDQTPFFLTARHCLEDRAESLQSLTVFWLFETPFCGGPAPDISTVPWTSYANYVRTTPSTDMSLVMLEGLVPRDLWWNGAAWLSSVPEDTGIVGIHHPRGTFKRWSWGQIWDEFDSCGATGLTEGNEIDWLGGLTEPGSSGSPLFIAGGFIVGVASCGPDPTVCGDDVAFYGRWGSHMGSYQAVLPTGSDDGFENNDSCGAATDLNGYGNTYFCDLVVKSVDEDWYHLTVPAFGNCRFETSFNNAWGNLDMELHDGCGGVLGSASSTTSNVEAIAWTNPGNSAREVSLRVRLANDTRNYYCMGFERHAATPPANDLCANATVLAQPSAQWQYAYGSTTAAASNQTPWCTDIAGGLDVFYKFTSNCTQEVTFDTLYTTPTFDTVLSVRTNFLTSSCGTALSGNRVACNDDIEPGNLQSSVTFTATAGSEYAVRVGGYNSTYFGNFVLAYRSSPPGNDTCNAPVVITPGTTPFNNCPATSNGFAEDVCAAFNSSQIYKDLWYEFTPDCYGTIDLNTIGSSFDTRLAVYAFVDNSSCPPGPNTALLCNDDIGGGNLQSQLIFACNPTQRYLFRVGSYGQSHGGAAAGDGVLNLVYTPADPCLGGGGGCDSIDFNNDGVFPDSLDIDDYLSVFGGGACSNDPNCNDIDFNNDGVFPDSLDIDKFLEIFGGGTC